MIGIQDLYRNDECLADTENIRFSLNPAVQSTAEKPSQFELYSDRMVRLFPKYSFDDRLRIRPSTETPTVRFTNLKEILLSTDLARNAELDWVSAKNLRFLDGADLALTGQQVCF